MGEKIFKKNKNKNELLKAEYVPVYQFRISGDFRHPDTRGVLPTPKLPWVFLRKIGIGQKAGEDPLLVA